MIASTLQTLDNGDQHWMTSDLKYHRLDGPAIIQYDAGYIAHFVEGKVHKVDGPAMVMCNEHSDWELWCQDGVPHRVDGPAFIDRKTGHEYWAIHGEITRQVNQPVYFPPPIGE